MFLRPSLCIERAEISSFARLRIFLAGIQPVLAGFQFSDHDSIEYSQIKWTPRVELQGDRLGSPILEKPAERLAYKGLGERFETQSTTSAARIARLVAR